MSTEMIIGAAILLLVLALVALAIRRRESKEELVYEHLPPERLSAPTPPTQAYTLDTNRMDEITAELRAGRKINAIKLYREATNLGLKEAKDAVDGIETALNRGLAMESFLANTGPITTQPESGTWMETVIAELRANRKINAIKIYRENSGLGLKEAKDAVDALEKKMKSG